MAVMDPRTGEVPAIVNGTGRDYRGLDLATMGPAGPAGRFVGSTFKPHHARDRDRERRTRPRTP